MEPLEIELGGEKSQGTCACCGHTSRCVWGYVHAGPSALAAYFVQWTVGRASDHSAHFDLIVGSWGESTRSEDRALVTLEYRLLAGGPTFMVVNANGRPA